MAKTTNAVDAHRKALKKKELKRNKEQRTKAKEIAVVKKDTRSIETDIQRLNEAAQRGPLSPNDKEELNRLRAELARVNKAKTEYVEAHPEHRKFVFPERASDSNQAGPSQQRELPGLYARDGKLKDPKRSFYYDPVFNPFGAPPPGMPYREREPTAEEIAAMHAAFQANIEAMQQQQQQQQLEESETSSDENSDEEEILMPEGPPPPNDAEESTSDSEDSDGIELPPGPPPPSANVHAQTNSHNRVDFARPSGFPPQRGNPRNHRGRGARPAPNNPTRPHHQLPQRPAGPVVQDPLADGPQQTFQSFQQAKREQANFTPLPTCAPPPTPSTSTGLPSPFAATTSAAATISAAPQLRDLKKEAVAFLPSHLRKKKTAPNTAANAGLGTINAAKGSEAVETTERANLMGALKGVGIGPHLPLAAAGDKKKSNKNEDYRKFEEEMAEFL